VPSAVDRSTDAERLRHGVNRLARLLRQQDDGDLGATSTAALATVRKRGPITLGELATAEQVSPPTMTKVVEKLEGRGFVSRVVDPNDRRVARVSITTAGSRFLDRSRARRTAWLAGRLDEIDPQHVAQLAHAIELLEALIGEPDCRPDSSGRSDR
jgi:DNA-binding MarR family transcriptional regulator